MKTFIKIAGLFLVSLFVLTSCSDDEYDYSLNKFWIGYATVSLNGDGKATQASQPDFDLILDDETVMKIAANFVYFPEGTELKDGTRVIVNFTILGDRILDGQKIYYIRLNGMQEVLSKKPVYSSEADEEEIGNDPVDVDDVWFGGRYLNFTFYLYINSPGNKHFINLWVDEEHPDADEDNIYVEFRHNAYDDKPVKKAFGRVSFDISEFLPEDKNSINVHVKYTDYEGRVITDSGVYTRKNNASGGERTVLNNYETGNIF